ncbi:MAG: hypothetical protein ACRC0V_01615 [Fusobacteriaceae bacterium]
MQINGYEVTKKVLKNKVKIFIKSKTEKIEFAFSGKDVNSDDYWYSLSIGQQLFDINIEDRTIVCLYPIIKNKTFCPVIYKL